MVCVGNGLHRTGSVESTYAMVVDNVAIATDI